MEMQKRSMEHMVVNCRNRIEELEKIFGVVEEKGSRNSSVRSVKTNNFF